jgi:hypothetical protein
LIWIKKQLKYSYLQLIVQRMVEGMPAGAARGAGRGKVGGDVMTVTKLEAQACHPYCLFIYWS